MAATTEAAVAAAEAVAPLPMGRRRAAKQAKLEKWQLDCIAFARTRIADWRIMDPLPIRIAGIGKHLGEYHGLRDGILIAPRSYMAGAKECKATILHELVHAHVGVLHAEGVIKAEPMHGPAFAKFALVLGLRSWGDKSWRWKYTCPMCGQWAKVHRRRRARQMVCSRGHEPMRMVERDLIPLGRAERARIAGRPVREKPVEAVVDPREERLMHARTMLAAWEKKQAMAERKVKEWTRYVRRLEARKARDLLKV